MSRLESLKIDEYGSKVIGDVQMVAFLRGLQGDFSKFTAIFAFGTAGTPQLSNTGATGQNGPSSLWGGTMANVKP